MDDRELNDDDSEALERLLFWYPKVLIGPRGRKPPALPPAALPPPVFLDKPPSWLGIFYVAVAMLLFLVCMIGSAEWIVSAHLRIEAPGVQANP